MSPRSTSISKITTVEPDCVECGKRGKLTSGAAIYPHRPDLYHKTFWLCACGAYCGSHPGSAVPLGKPAGPKTRAARSRAHAAFDPLWKAKGGPSRGSAYRWLADQLGIVSTDCHIGWMDADTADRAVELCKAFPRGAQ